jgi:hypothetical protein
MSAIIREVISIDINHIACFAGMIEDVHLFRNEQSLRVIDIVNRPCEFGTEEDHVIQSRDVIMFGAECLSIAIEKFVHNENMEDYLLKLKHLDDMNVDKDDIETIEEIQRALRDYCKILHFVKTEKSKLNIMPHIKYNVETRVEYKGRHPENKKWLGYEIVLTFTIMDYKKIQEEALKIAVAPVVNAAKKDKKKTKKEQTKNSNKERNRKEKEREAYYKSIGVVYKKK